MYRRSPKHGIQGRRFPQADDARQCSAKGTATFNSKTIAGYTERKRVQNIGNHATMPLGIFVRRKRKKHYAAEDMLCATRRVAQCPAPRKAPHFRCGQWLAHRMLNSDEALSRARGPKPTVRVVGFCHQARRPRWRVRQKVSSRTAPTTRADGSVACAGRQG